MTTNPASRYFAVTPSDTVALSEVARGLYIGTSGDVAVKNHAGQSVTFVAVPVGVLPVVCTHVLATGTDADDIVALV